MPEVIQWRPDQPDEPLATVLRQLQSGKLVGLPTDTCYVAATAACDSDALQRLLGKPGNSSQTERPVVAVNGLQSVLQWLPELSLVGRRFAARCWPGPLTLSVAAKPEKGIGRELTANVIESLFRGARLHVRFPAHEAIVGLMAQHAGPILFRELCDSAGAGITREEEAVCCDVDLLLTNGATYFSNRATIVEIDGSEWKIARAGVLTEEDLRMAATCRIVFICTGNTCRSPLAEALCKKLLAEELGCGADDLPRRGFLVQSAGLAAATGRAASSEAVTAGRELGVDLSAHLSRPLTMDLLTESDYLFTMTNTHLQLLSFHDLCTISTPELLSVDGEDVADPMGGENELYRQCASQILALLRRRLSNVLAIEGCSQKGEGESCK